VLETLYTKKGSLAFRQFAMGEFARPTVDLSDLGSDEVTDLLKLSLLSFREMMAHGFATKRENGEGFIGYPAHLDCQSLNAFAGFHRDTYVSGGGSIAYWL